MPEREPNPFDAGILREGMLATLASMRKDLPVIAYQLDSAKQKLPQLYADQWRRKQEPRVPVTFNVISMVSAENPILEADEIQLIKLSILQWMADGIKVSEAAVIEIYRFQIDPTDKASVHSVRIECRMVSPRRKWWQIIW